VGVVDNVRYRNLTQSMLDGPNSPDVFFSIEQVPSRTLEVSFRSDADVASVLPAVRRAVASLDPAIPLFAVESLEHAYEGLTATPRFAAFLMGLFSLMALALSGVGLYGVLAFTVGQRSPEIALRRALGAGAGEVAGSVVVGALRLALVGLALGGAGAWLGTRSLQALLFQVRPTDPATFGAMAGAMLVVAALAAAVPAWRATRRSPAEALNAE
jgi:putative ABC transport system permease protein